MCDAAGTPFWRAQSIGPGCIDRLRTPLPGTVIGNDAWQPHDFGERFR